jgi:hypothetical protein
LKLLRTISAAWALFLATGSIFVHPFGKVKTEKDQKPLFYGAQIDPAVFSALRRSCQDCHSERTVWPWYSYIAPVSWLVEKDVRDGRAHFNMSHWDEYTSQEQSQLLAEISVMVRNRQMPLPRYTVLHPKSQLSDQEVQSIDQWGHQERRRVKDKDPRPPGKSGKATVGARTSNGP